MAAPSRLSPAANLLRNSKLFALPAAIPLPPSIPTAEPRAGSNTATTIYPTRAAIATPQIALVRGDWGFKRALPLKSTTNTSTPTVRLTQDIDSAGHVTDFESAADHVQTFAKWQDVHIQIKNKPSWSNTNANTTRFDGRKLSVFHPQLDNTTADSQQSPLSTHNPKTETPEHLREPLQALRRDREAAALENGQTLPPPPILPEPRLVQTKRWRYQGPWLAGMSELQFEAYLNQFGQEKVAAFEDRLKSKIVASMKDARVKRLAAAADANDEASPSTLDLPPIEVTPDDVTDALRRLRQDPQSFGPEIAAFLDLADGPAAEPSHWAVGNRRTAWKYRSDESTSTVASSSYRDVGPPRTHPSAGFSYLRSGQLAKNSPQYGPQRPQVYLPARVLKDRTPREDKATQGPQAQGVGGFVSRTPQHLLRSGVAIGDQWTPQKRGTKFVARVTEMTIAQDGSMELEADRVPRWQLQNNVPVSEQVLSGRQAEAALKNAPPRLERLPRLDDRSTPKQTEEIRDATKPNDETADILRQLDESFLARKRS